jgi:ABC-type uncharacterized transport system fused permease/ATPase subunit
LLEQRVGNTGDAPDFYRKLLLVIIYNVMLPPAIAFGGYVSAKLMINWRQWLTEEFLNKSFHDRTFYRISFDTPMDWRMPDSGSPDNQNGRSDNDRDSAFAVRQQSF